MSYLSPDVNVKEQNFAGALSAAVTTTAAIAGKFSQGPLNVPVLIQNEDQLLQVFGKPDETNYMEWFAAAQFLLYSQSLYVTRAAPTGILNATWSSTGFLVDNIDTFYGMTSGNITTTGPVVAKNAGKFGNDLGVIIVDAAGWTAFSAWALALKSQMPNNLTFDSYFSAAPATSSYVSNLAVNPAEAKNDEVHVLIYDATGNITGKKYTKLESWQGLSKAVDATDYKGATQYFKDFITLNSQYIYTPEFPTTTQSTSTSLDANAGKFATDISAVGYNFAPFDFTSVGTTYSLAKQLSGGVAGTTPTDAQVITAYGKYANPEQINIGHIITAGFGTTVLQYCTQTLAAGRQDAISYITLFNSTPGTPIKDTDTAPESIVTAAKTSLNIAEQDNQYAFYDNTYKYVYDKYNRKYRWIPLNGDTAGIAARLGFIAEEFYSPGGFNRGGYKNVLKFSFNASKPQRDVFYPKGINAAVNFTNQGPTLWGDRMGVIKPSAFDRYNVRRLFIILEKTISLSSQYKLFEFNDAFTQAAFVNEVEPFLRSIQGKRGITDFKVLCNSTNNTAQVVDSNQFVGSIAVKPAKSINWVTLNFISTASGISFNTVLS